MEETHGLGDIFDLTFTKFVTPMVIKILYILVMVFAALMWIFAIIAGLQSGFMGFLGGLIFGGLAFLMLILLYRIMFELVMVVFAIKRNTDRL